MKNILLIILCLSNCFYSAAQNLFFYIEKPRNYQKFHDSVDIEVYVSPEDAVSRVTAEINEVMTTLKYNKYQHRYLGNISIADFSYDTLSLIATITDTLNMNYYDTVRIIHADNVPQLIIDSPVEYSVARPLLHLKLKCIDEDTCYLKVKGTDFAYLINNEVIRDSFDTMLNLSAYNDRATTLTITVTDKFNQSASIAIYPVYTDSSHNLNEYYVSAGEIKDFNNNKVLSRDPYSNNLELYDFATNVKTIIPVGGTSFISNARITAFGVLFTAASSENSYNDSLFEWRQDTLYNLGSYARSFLKVNGNYAIWLNRKSNGLNDLYRRNLADYQNVVVNQNSYDYADIGANGLVAYYKCSNSSNNCNIYSYKDSSIKLTEAPNGTFNQFPLTDGRNIMFVRNASMIFYNNGISNIELSDMNGIETNPLADYQVNNNFLAYMKLDDSSVKQVWLKDSLNNKIQVSFIKSDNMLDLLNERGDIMYTRRLTDYGQRRRLLFLKEPGIMSEQICSGLGGTVFYDGNWYVVMGRVLYKLHIPSILPLTLLSFTAEKQVEYNLLKWSTSEEQNTDRFEIQRSSNSRDFAKIGTVRSLNNGKSRNDYVFTDAQPLKAVNYYRLKMLDKDGKFTYSAIKNINNTASFDVTLYPNPVRQNLTLSFNTEKTIDVQVEILNTEGKKIYTKKMQLPYGASLQSINVAALKAGNYFVKCITADGQTGLKFVKQ